MTEKFEKEDGNVDLWTTVFADGHPDLKKQHKLHKMFPRDPRCRMCMAPFKGIGGWWFGRKGKKPSSRNPHYCAACDGFLDAFPGGAEVEMSIFFVDIRNSVAYAQDAKPAEVQRRVTAFLDRATEVITDNDGFIMAFYGDCVVAVWPPGFSGPDHAAKAAATAQALLAKPVQDAAGHDIAIGVGVHCGPVFIGTVTAGKGLFRDVSVFGHNVNLCARLADLAHAGQACLSGDLARHARVTGEAVPQSLKGIEGDVPVVTLTA